MFVYHREDGARLATYPRLEHPVWVQPGSQPAQYQRVHATYVWVEATPEGLRQLRNRYPFSVEISEISDERVYPNYTVADGVYAGERRFSTYREAREFLEGINSPPTYVFEYNGGRVTRQLLMEPNSIRKTHVQDG